MHNYIQPQDVHGGYTWDHVKLISAIAAFFYIFGVFSEQLYAEPRRPAIEPGITTAQLLNMWGSPTERQEREVSREELWFYGSRTLLIRSGKFVEELQSVPAIPAKSVPVSKEVKPLPKTDSGPVKSKTTAPRPPQSTREILSEIMKNYPDDGVVDASKNAPMPAMPPGAQPGAMPAVAPPAMPQEMPSDIDAGLDLE